jgi:hypothetical protein
MSDSPTFTGTYVGPPMDPALSRPSITSAQFVYQQLNAENRALRDRVWAAEQETAEREADIRLRDREIETLLARLDAAGLL